MKVPEFRTTSVWRFDAHRRKKMNFVVLPKLSDAQLNFLARALLKKGFRKRRSQQKERSVVEQRLDLTMGAGKARITLLSKGIAVSDIEGLDYIAPHIDSLTEFPKERIEKPVNSKGMVRNGYFDLILKEKNGRLILKPRVEGYGKEWSDLRSVWANGLAPDEHYVSTRIIEALRPGMIETYSNFVPEGAEPSSYAIKAGRVYFDIKLALDEYLEAAERTTVNLMKDVVNDKILVPPPTLTLKLGKVKEMLKPQLWNELFEELDEWCYDQAHLMPQPL